MFLAFAPNSLSFWIAVLTVLFYFTIMYLKKRLIGQTPTKTQSIINVVVNVVILVGAVIVIMLANEEFSFKSVIDSFKEWVTHQTEVLIGTAFVIIISLTVYNTIKVILNHSGKRGLINEKRRITIAKVILSCARYLLYFVDAAIILSLWGIDITPVLAGLGIAGLVIGLGAQKLIVDFISGIFIVFERHFDVGDIVGIGDFKGEVIDIGLKTTKVKNWKNEVKLFSNGSIEEVINYSMFNSVAVVDVRIPFQEKAGAIIDLLNKEITKHLPDLPNLLTPPTVVGMVDMVDNNMTFRITANTVSEQQYGVERAIRKAVKDILEEHHIAYPKQEIKIFRGEDHDRD